MCIGINIGKVNWELLAKSFRNELMFFWEKWRNVYTSILFSLSSSLAPQKYFYKFRFQKNTSHLLTGIWILDVHDVFFCPSDLFSASWAFYVGLIWYSRFAWFVLITPGGWPIAHPPPGFYHHYKKLTKCDLVWPMGVGLKQCKHVVIYEGKHGFQENISTLKADNYSFLPTNYFSGIYIFITSSWF